MFPGQGGSFSNVSIPWQLPLRVTTHRRQALPKHAVHKQKYIRRGEKHTQKQPRPQVEGNRAEFFYTEKNRSLVSHWKLAMKTNCVIIMSKKTVVNLDEWPDETQNKPPDVRNQLHVSACNCVCACISECECALSFQSDVFVRNIKTACPPASVYTTHLIVLLDCFLREKKCGFSLIFYISRKPVHSGLFEKLARKKRETKVAGKLRTNQHRIWAWHPIAYSWGNSTSIGINRCKDLETEIKGKQKYASKKKEPQKDTCSRSGLAGRFPAASSSGSSLFWSTENSWTER